MKRGRYEYLFSLLLLFAFVSCAVFGCGTSESSSPATSTAPSSTIQSSTNGEVSTATVDRQPVVPGTGTLTPQVDDPRADGWQSELFATQVDDQLKQLMRCLPGYADQVPTEWSAVVAESAVCEPLRPRELDVVYDSPSIVVRRRIASTTKTNPLALDSNDDTAAETYTAANNTALDRLMIESLLSGVETPRNIHSKVKVFRVGDTGSERAADEHIGLRSSVYLQIWGECDDGTFQINTTWQCHWVSARPSTTESSTAESPAAGSSTLAPRLSSIDVEKYEEVVIREVAAGMPLFADCTEAVLAGEVFREQLLPGVDHWLGAIESRLGIDVGGWQGLSIADVNGDGLDDLYCCQPGGLPNRLYLQQPDGTCVEAAADAGLDWLDSCHAAVFVDLDNDGDQDAVVGLPDGVLALENDGQTHFAVRAAKILPAALPYSLSAADYDLDGDLDIYICCYNRRSGVNQHLLFARPVPYHDANNGGRNVLLRNDINSEQSANNDSNATTSDWQFRYVTAQVGLDVNNRRFSYASAWEDYDDDGDPDLYVANDFGRNNLYRNDDGHFVDVTSEAGVEDISPGMSACWGDYNNDGRMDLYVSNMFSSAGNRITFQDRFLQQAGASTRAEFQRHARGNSLFENLGNGAFRDVSEAASVVLGRWAWGSRFVDLNGDGWQDLVVANGFITQRDTGDL